MYHILYVDDEPSLLDIGKLFLEVSVDFSVTTALSATEGIRLLEKEKFDAIKQQMHIFLMLRARVKRTVCELSLSGNSFWASE